MLERGLVEITSPAAGEYAFHITADGRAYKFADLAEKLGCVFERSFVDTELDEARINEAIQRHGVFTLGKRS